jgi:hypothetical protein
MSASPEYRKARLEMAAAHAREAARFLRLADGGRHLGVVMGLLEGLAATIDKVPRRRLRNKAGRALEINQRF